MLNSIISRVNSEYIIFIVFSIVSLACFVLSLFFEQFVLAILPFGLLVLAFAVIDVRKIFFLFFLFLPFSIEFSVSDSLGTDLPSEPIMLLLSLICLFLLFNRFYKIDIKGINNPITILLVLHVVWMLVCSVLSVDPVVSFKFFIAKIWYILPFYVLPLFLLKEKKDWLSLIRIFLCSMTLAVLYVMVNHISLGLSFKSINNAVSPVFRNHVNYACILLLSIPFLCLWIKWHKGRRIMLYLKYALMLLFLIALYFSYTRVALVSMGIGIVSYFIIRLNLLKVVLFSTVLITAISVSYLVMKNNYLQFTPNYERTIAHYKFDQLIDATYKMEDISVMERVYRWVAGYHMIREHPFFGSGPGTFYAYYKSFTVSSFKTYVSDNPEKSGIHNYYLMTAVEQGFIGAFFFLLLLFGSLLYGQRKYLALPAGYERDITMAGMILLILISSILLINDMLEAAKVGTIFFFSLYMIIRPAFFIGKEN